MTTTSSAKGRRSSTMSIAGVQGMTLVSNRGRLLGAPNRAGSGDGEGSE
jgi:hypothetical protein